MSDYSRRPASDLPSELHWLLVQSRISFKLVCLTYKILYSDQPIYIVSYKNWATFIFALSLDSVVRFLPRDAICVDAVFAVGVARYLSVSLSVRPYVTSVDCIQVGPVAHHSSFLIPAPVPNSKENPFNGAKYRGGKILRLSTEIAVYLGNGKAHGCYETLIGSHMRFIEW